MIFLNQYTNTDDWLHTKLLGNEDVFISGHYSFSERIGISQDVVTSLRFAANRREIFGYFLTVNAPFISWESIENEIDASNYTIEKIKMFSNLLNFPITVILYDNEKEGVFSVSTDLTRFQRVNSLGLKIYFSKYNPKIVQNPGTFKDINRSINDSFQVWTRKNLSKYLVVNDFDMIVPKKSMIFEFKRIQEDISSWKPYLDDKSNYLALMKICESNNLEMKVIAYGQEAHKVALHDLKDVNDDTIIGQFITCELDEILDDYRDTKYSLTKYQSNRRRQIH